MCYVGEEPNIWILLPWTKSAYNITYYTKIKKLLFEVLHWRPPPKILTNVVNTSDVDAVMPS